MIGLLRSASRHGHRYRCCTHSSSSRSTVVVARSRGHTLFNRPCNVHTCIGLTGVRHNTVVSQDAVPPVHTSASPEDRWWHVWKYKYLRLVLRGMRVAVLAGALYQTGVQSGQHMYAQDPDLHRNRLIKEVLGEHGALDANGNPKVLDKNSPKVKVVQRVFPRVLNAAIEEARCQEQELKKRAATENVDVDSELEQLRVAKRQLKNWSQDGFLVLDKEEPNAFVTAMVPRMIFVFSGLFDTEHRYPVHDFLTLAKDTELVAQVKGGIQYYSPHDERRWSFKKTALYKCWFVGMQEGRDGLMCIIKLKWDRNSFIQVCVPVEDVQRHWTYSVCETDEQLAMLLSHELSHVLHSHSEDDIQLTAIFLGMQLVLLALLDVTGFVSMFAVLGMAPAVKYAVTLPHSREHEMEADATGLRIAARAMYNPKDAGAFFERLAEFSSEVVGEPAAMSWSSTHPATEDRIEALHAIEAKAMKYYERAQSISARNVQALPHDSLLNLAAAGGVTTFVGLSFLMLCRC